MLTKHSRQHNSLQRPEHVEYDQLDPQRLEQFGREQPPSILALQCSLTKYLQRLCGKEPKLFGIYAFSDYAASVTEQAEFTDAALVVEKKQTRSGAANRKQRVDTVVADQNAANESKCIWATTIA